MAFGLSLSLIVVVNSYQNTMLIEEKMPHVNLSPFCVELFRSRHPIIALSDTLLVRIAIQAMKPIQGTNTVGKS